MRSLASVFDSMKSMKTKGKSDKSLKAATSSLI